MLKRERESNINKEVIILINEILTLAAIITAITTIITIPINLYKKFRKKLDEEKEFKANVIKTLNEIKEKQEKTELYVLKDTILNDKLTIEERITAGDEYVKLGGNGFVKEVYHTLLKKVEKEYEGGM